MTKFFADFKGRSRAFLFVLALVASAVIRPAEAQVYRSFGVGSLVLDDNHRHTLILQTPQPGDPGYTDWTSGGNLVLRLPIPPTTNAIMGFVMPGPATTGSSQVLVWDAPVSGGGTGGAQGVWRPASLASAISSLGVISGSGPANSLTKWTGGSTVGNSTISEIGGSVTFGGYGAGVLHSDASGAITSSPVDLTSDVSGMLPLSHLPAGSSGQVLGMTGGVPTWITNGATITNTTNTPAAINLSQNDYTIDPTSTYIRLTNVSGGSLDITGISSTGVMNGRVITLVNTSPNAIMIKNQNPASAPPDQFDLPGGSDILLGQKGAATFIYDAALHYWELMSTN